MCKVGNIILIDKYKHGTNCKVIEVDKNRLMCASGIKVR